MEQHKKHILYCILNWGLGHASRSIPIINYLIREGYHVTLAADGMAAELLQRTFPRQKLLPLPAYRIVYGKYVLWSLIKQLPQILMTIRAEHNYLQDWFKQHACDLIISDNRYGAYTKNIPSVLITHQLNYPGNKIKQWAAQLLYGWLANPFKEIWIPDHPHPRNLSGILSENSWMRKKCYIGPWSALPSSGQMVTKLYDLTLVLSGPEPNRTWLQDAFIRLIKKEGLPAALICGTNTSLTTNIPDHLTVFGLLSAEEISSVVSQSKLVLCRSGYSSIMDWAIQNRPVVLIPTPGQPEQTYLAKWLHTTYLLPVVQENELERCLAYLRRPFNGTWPKVIQDYFALQSGLQRLFKTP